MLYKNAWIFRDTTFVYGSFRVEKGLFVEVRDTVSNESGCDLEGACVIPGLVDIHVHGSQGVDFSDGNYDGLISMANYLAQCGVTSFVPASMTLPYDILENAFLVGKRFFDKRPTGCAKLMGFQMEGPYFAESKKGAQNGAFLKMPDVEGFLSLQASCGGLIRVLDLAPELPGSEAFIRAVCQSCTVAVGHTNACYSDAVAAFHAGATHVTHLFNCMPPIHHRNPGVIGAAAEREFVTAELICDGFHIHPSVIRMAYQLFPGRICLISDALRCCGIEDGNYLLGGQTVKLENGIARLADGTIAGSATNLFECMRKAVSFGIPMGQAIYSATMLPAKIIGREKEIGSIHPGKAADFVVCSHELKKKAVYIDGVQIS